MKKMNFRTDLAMERREYHKKKTLDGVIFTERESEGITINDVSIVNDEGSRLLLKPQGRYITLISDGIPDKTFHNENFIRALSKEIASLIPKKGTALVLGLGNSDITPDALGPKCASGIISTRHIQRRGEPSFFRSVCAIAPGVLGKTGIEAAETVKGICQKVKPDFIIAVDALASRSVARLGTTVQLCNSGITPGSGVGNHRSAIDEKSLGVPVIAIGVPTVVDGATMTLDLLERSGLSSDDEIFHSEIEKESRVFVTPKDIDRLITCCASVLSLAINKALQPRFSLQEIRELID